MTIWKSITTALLLSLALAGCLDTSSSQNNGTTAQDAAGDTSVEQDGDSDAAVDDADDATRADSTSDDAGGDLDTSPLGPDDREAEVVLPSDYDAAQAYPLVFLLHGYTGNADIQDTYLQVSNKVDDYDFILVLPDGTIDGGGNRFWNATSWCCDFYGSGVDDASYLEGLMDEAEARFNVDPARIYFMGHSNGGFMSYRMACDYSDRVAAVASLAGSGFVEAEQCDASEPVAVLQAHGTADATIAYNGTAGQYPGAETLMERWASRNGCAQSPTAKGEMDLVTGGNGDETEVLEWEDCSDGTSTVLWKMNGAPHIPGFTSGFTTGVLDFLLAHER